MQLKVEGQKDNLRYLANRKPSLRPETEKAIRSIDQMMESQQKEQQKEQPKEEISKEKSHKNKKKNPL